jgi:hypothetical protein
MGLRGGATMRLTTSMIPDLLSKKPRRYIHHNAGSYRMKEANGEDVKLTKDGKEYLVEPTPDQIDDLMDAEKLVRDGSTYALPPEP